MRLLRAPDYPPQPRSRGRPCNMFALVEIGLTVGQRAIEIMSACRCAGCEKSTMENAEAKDLCTVVFVIMEHIFFSFSGAGVLLCMHYPATAVTCTFVNGATNYFHSKGTLAWGMPVPCPVLIWGAAALFFPYATSSATGQRSSPTGHGI